MSKDDCFRDNLPQINVVRRVRIGHEMRLDLFFGYFVALSAFWFTICYSSYSNAIIRNESLFNTFMTQIQELFCTETYLIYIRNFKHRGSFKSSQYFED